MGSITIYTIGHVDCLGIGHQAGALPPSSYWRWYSYPDVLSYWSLPVKLDHRDVICVAWSPDDSHYCWDVHMWSLWFRVPRGLYLYGDAQLEWVDDVEYVSHRLERIVPPDIIPSPLYYAKQDWNWAWEMTALARMIVWYPSALGLPWYQ